MIYEIKGGRHAKVYKDDIQNEIIKYNFFHQSNDYIHVSYYYNRSYDIEYHFYKYTHKQLEMNIDIPQLVSSNIDDEKITLVMKDIYVNQNHIITLNYKNIYTIFDMMMIWYKKNENKKVSSIWNHGAYWTGEKRIRSKLDFIHRWDSFLHTYQIPPMYHFLGNKINEKLHEIVFFYKTQKWNTIIHGDFKPHNIGFVDHDNNRTLSVFDWQWVGYGHPITDLFYFLFHSLSNEELNYKNIMFILLHYESNVYLIHMILLDYFVYSVTCKLYAKIHNDYTIENIHALIQIIYSIINTSISSDI